MKPDLISSIVLWAIIACWMGFGIVFGLRKRASRQAETKLAAASRWGIAVQGLSFGLVWSVRRRLMTPIASVPPVWEIAAGIVTVIIGAASVALCLAAVRTLGKQWSCVARIVEGHKLITQGPYGFVRNPIYLGMLGMLLATGLAVSRWWALPIAVPVFLVGSCIRIRSEEKLLRESFGAEFDDYARRVPAMFPRVFS